MRYYPQTTQKTLHQENQPRNVVLFTGDVGLNTYSYLPCVLQNLPNKPSQRHPEPRRIPVPAAAELLGHRSHIDFAARAERAFHLAIRVRVPEQSKAPAFFRQPFAKLRGK